jgi:DNA repair protein RecO (recombination protein O)
MLSAEHAGSLRIAPRSSLLRAAIDFPQTCYANALKRLSRMPARTSESFILQTYPFRESDLIVSFFTRDQGKLRGVAHRARRPKNSFGSALERLSHATVSYYQKENRELVSLNSCELLHSQFALASNYESSVALDYLAEITEQLLPPNETNERHFRLLIAVLDYLRSGGNFWPAVTYFALWSVRLAGFLPELRVRSESRDIAEEMLVTPVQALAPRSWTRETAADLRRLLNLIIEEHIERKLCTPAILENI